MSVDISRNNIDHIGAGYVAQCIASTSAPLQSLHPDPQAGLTVRTAEDVTVGRCLLHTVTMDGNPLGVTGGMLLAEALQYNQRLRVLSMAGTLEGEEPPSSVFGGCTASRAGSAAVLP